MANSLAHSVDTQVKPVYANIAYRLDWPNLQLYDIA